MGQLIPFITVGLKSDGVVPLMVFRSKLSQGLIAPVSRTKMTFFAVFFVSNKSSKHFPSVSQSIC